MPEQARWVGAMSADRTYVHAVWVETNTSPLNEGFYTIPLDPAERRRHFLATDAVREGTAICGAALPVIIAGEQGGHDWDRVSTEDKCGFCHAKIEDPFFVEEFEHSDG